MTENDGTIDMTSEQDQNYGSEEADPDPFDAVEHYEQTKAYFEERGWDTDRLTPPEEYREEDESGDVSKAADPSAVIAATDSAVERGPWWEETEYRNGTAIEKAPGIWRESDQVPEYVRDFIEQVIEETDWDWHTFESLSAAEADRLVDILKEKLTQPQGWSLSSLSADLQEEFDLDEDAAVGIAADTSHNVLATSREEAYEEMEGSEDFEYDWVGPTDHRTTDVCLEIEEEIDAKGGSVTMPTLKQILRQKAQKYEGTDQGGTPQRVEHWEPHYQCRRVLVRRVQSM